MNFNIRFLKISIIVSSLPSNNDPEISQLKNKNKKLAYSAVVSEKK